MSYAVTVIFWPEGLSVETLVSENAEFLIKHANDYEYFSFTDEQKILQEWTKRFLACYENGGGKDFGSEILPDIMKRYTIASVPVRSSYDIETIIITHERISSLQRFFNINSDSAKETA